MTESTTTTTSLDSLLLFVWDFDWTIVNCNSDEYVPAQFYLNNNGDDDHADDGLDQLNEEFRRRFVEESGGQDWQATVQGVIQDLVAQGRADPSSLQRAARQMPFLKRVQATLRRIHQEQVQRDQNESVSSRRRIQQMILSDGNSLFIGDFLEQHEMRDLFERVVTNQARWFDVNDKNMDNTAETKASAALSPLFQITHQSQEYANDNANFTCPEHCLSNLCKTQALQKTLASLQGNSDSGLSDNDKKSPRRIIYIGDGGNDACPVLHALGSNDVLLARAGFRDTNWANRQAGVQDDQDSDTSTKKEGSPFGILPSLQKAARRSKNPCVPACDVREWRTGEELYQLVESILNDNDQESATETATTTTQ